jgi:predicted ArsR family transcriptional regulator
MIDLPPAGGLEDVLAQPTRARLFALLHELAHPAGTAELADRLGLHPNGVRTHLERLCKAGLVVRVQVRHARGRPPDAWTIAPDARPGGAAPSAYRDLGRWLARTMSTRCSGLRSVEATGREIGRELGFRQDRSGIDAFTDTLTALGFQPMAQETEGEHLLLTLRNCPYRDAVLENQPAICTLHRGITRGLLDTLIPSSKLASFEPHDPKEAGCTVELARTSTPGEQ